MKKLIVFATGSEKGGGSGFMNLVESSARLDPEFRFKVVAVVSNHIFGGVRMKSIGLDIPFEYFPPPRTADGYRRIVEKWGADFVALSGWIKKVKGLDPRTTINIHPGPLPAFGGQGMYGHHVHERVMHAAKLGLISHSEVCMHFVTEKYDDGPVFFRKPVPIFDYDDADSLGMRVNKCERDFQPWLTALVVNGRIKWDGINRDSLFIEPQFAHMNSPPSLPSNRAP